MAKRRFHQRKHVHITFSTVVLGALSVLLAVAAVDPGLIPHGKPAPGTTTTAPAAPHAHSSNHNQAVHVSSTVAASRTPSKPSPPTTPQTNVAPTAMTPKYPHAISSIPLPPPKPGNGHINYPYVALMAPNDPQYSSQWHLPRVNAPKAWDVTTGKSTITVAVIDTGFNLAHEDLAGQWRTNAGEMGPTTQQGPAPNCTSRGLPLDKSCNNLDNDGDGYASDWRGWDFANGDNSPAAGTTNTASTVAFHGSFVSGLIGAGQNNGVGMAGVAGGVRLMPLEALTDDGVGYTDDIAAAVTYAADHGANVINMSLGSTYDDPVLHQAIDSAIARGVTVVAAAGNAGCDCVAYPGNYPEVITVGATDQNDTLASFSSYGANMDLVAPGTDMCSTTWASGNATNTYGCGGAGTSFAAPVVSGAAALLLSQRPNLSPAEVSAYLAEGAYKPPGMQNSLSSPQYGAGRLDIFLALLQTTLPLALDPAAAKLTPTAYSLSQNTGIVTVCQTVAAPLCGFQLTGASNQVVTIPAQQADQWGGAIIYWNPTQAGLTPGTWRISGYSGVGSVLTSPASLSISP